MSLRHPYRLIAVLSACLLLTACNGETTDDTASDARIEGSTTQLTDDETPDEDATGGATDDANDGSATEDATAPEETPTDDATATDQAAAVDVGCELDVPDVSQDTAGTALSAIPELSTLADAAAQADLVATLDDPEASFTVFAPVDDAFDAVPQENLDLLLSNQQDLTETLTYHLVGTASLSLQDLADEGSVLTMQAGELQIEVADPETVTVGPAGAQVICADVQAANATIHLIDGVLFPDQPAEEEVDSDTADGDAATDDAGAADTDG